MSEQLPEGRAPDPKDYGANHIPTLTCDGEHGPLCVCCGVGHYREPVGEYAGYPVCWYCQRYYTLHPMDECLFENAVACAREFKCGPVTALMYACRNLDAERQVFGDVTPDQRARIQRDLQRELGSAGAA